MKLIEIQSEVGFSDGEILGCERAGSVFVVHIKAWNSMNIRVEFKGVQLALDWVTEDISGFYRYDGKTELMQKALDYAYDTPPKQHACKHFVFINNDGQPCLEIVADEMTVIVV